MLADTKEILIEAQKNNYAIAAFSVYSMETVQAAVNAAENEQMPVILAIGERYFEHVNIEALSSYIQTAARGTSVPVALHLDHAYEEESILRAIRNGFTSVMFDGSAYSFEENIRLTKRMTEIAHKAGVSIEAEIGSLALGAHSDEKEGKGDLTDPIAAKEFAERTGIDFLAPAIGTVHGLNISKPDIKMDLLENIEREVDIPLVLHGGSDTSDDLLKELIKRGICKINVNTDISIKAVSCLAEELKKNPSQHLSDLLLKMQEEMQESMSRMIRVFKMTEK